MTQLAVERLANSLESLLGSERVRSAKGSEIAIANLIVEPASVSELSELVRKCEADSITLAPFGTGNILRYIRTSPAQIGVSLVRMRNVINYEPHDMTIIAQAGITLGELNRIMAEHRQQLPLDPPHPDSLTLGSLVAAAKAGPLRLSEGRVRDLLIGIEFVGHQGRISRAGGRVVKNVTGYDLMKVMTGSYGTLGVITETIFKVRPLPEQAEILLAHFQSADDAFSHADVLHERLPLLHLEVLSPALSVKLTGVNKFLLISGIGGNQAEVEYQRGIAHEVLKPSMVVLSGTDAAQTYVSLRDLELENTLIEAKIAVLPATLSQCLKDLGCEFLAYAGSGVARVFFTNLQAKNDVVDLVNQWRDIAHRHCGYVQLVSLAEEVRNSRVPMFDSVNDGAMKLMVELKRRFDPVGIFNPGCFIGGI